jgi:uncharacterized OsmC-like protein
MSDVAGETGKGDFQVEVKAGTSTFLMAGPVQAGGLGSGPNPYDLLSAAIGACALARLLDISMRCPVHLTMERGSIVETRLAHCKGGQRPCANMLGTLARLVNSKPGRHIRPSKAISRINAHDSPFG